MKLVMDERVKHRIVGLAVLLSIAAIFLPAILKKSNHPFESMSRVAVRLPSRPPMLQVKRMDEARLFKTVKVTKVVLPKLAALPPMPVIAKATSLEPISKKIMVAEAKPVSASVVPILPKVIERKPVAVVKKVIPVAMKQPARVVQSGYTLQVANFMSLQNAQSLVLKLHAKGFPANYIMVRTARGVPNYRVLVGRSIKREEVLRLQSQVSSAMQLRGFVVPAEIG